MRSQCGSQHSAGRGNDFNTIELSEQFFFCCEGAMQSRNCAARYEN